jgi:iron complex outermembrane receptor protein
MKYVKGLGWSLAVVAIIISASICIPRSAIADSVAEGRSDTLQEIVVTAQKREENLQKVPLTIDVVSAAQLASAGAVSTADLNALVPGMQVAAFGPYAMISIRGIGSQQGNQFGDPVVNYNVDGVIQDRSINASTGFYDVERIEVLKGPQGTLYGRNATAGAINVINNKPTNEFAAAAQVDVGNYRTLNTTGFINAPISETLSSRFSFQTVNHTGYFQNGYNDADETSVRARFLFKPSSAVSVLFSADYSHQGGKGPQDVPLPLVGNPWNSSWYNSSVLASTVGTPYVPQSYYNIAPFQNNTFYGFSAQLDVDLGFATLTVLPGFRYTHQFMDYHTFDTYSYLDDPTRQATFEARLGHVSDGSPGSLTWVGGIYAYRLTQTAVAAYEFNCFCSNDASPTYIPSPNNVGRNLTDLNSRSYAGFTQGTYSFTERLRGTIGGRYTHDQKTEGGSQATNLYTIGVVVTPPDAGRATWSNWSWKVGLDADLSKNSLLYASVSTGYKTGGLNEGDNSPPYQPETLTAYAIGSKNQLWDGRINLNGEIFYWNYKDHQVATTSGFPGGGGLGYVGVNIPKSTEYGVDLDLQALLTPNDRVNLSAEYLVGTTGAYTLPTSTAGVYYTTSGTSMINAPRWNVTTTLSHQFNLSNGASLTAAGLVHITSQQLLYPIAIPVAYSPATGTMDLDLTYKAPKDTWYAQAYVKNVTERSSILAVFAAYETRDYIGPNPGADYRNFGFVNDPRTFGVRIGTRF